MRVLSGARGNVLHIAVDGPHRILDRALLKGLGVRHLHGRIQGGLLYKQVGNYDVDLVIGVDSTSHERKQGGNDDVDLVIGVGLTSHGRERGLTAHQSYLDIDAVDQEFIM